MYNLSIDVCGLVLWVNLPVVSWHHHHQHTKKCIVATPIQASYQGHVSPQAFWAFSGIVGFASVSVCAWRRRECRCSEQQEPLLAQPPHHESVPLQLLLGRPKLTHIPAPNVVMRAFPWGAKCVPPSQATKSWPPLCPTASENSSAGGRYLPRGGRRGRRKCPFQRVSTWSKW